MDKFTTVKAFTEFESFTTSVLTRSDRYTEFQCSYNEPLLGSANTHLIKMPHLALNYTVSQIENPLQLKIGNASEQMDSLFLLEGTVESDFDLLSHTVTPKKDQHAFHYSPDPSATHILSRGLHRAVHVSYDLGFYKSLMQSASQKQTDVVCEHLEKKKVFFAPPEQMYLQPQMKDILNAIINCQFQSDTRLLYLEAKTFELFSLQMLQLNTTTHTSRDTISLADKEKLKAVYAFIEENYLLPHSLKDLSATFLLNEFKLKSGYKALFNTTVFNHIYHLRMAKAKQLLAKENMSVSMVSDFIGYYNIAAFSSAFKRRFGYSPKDVVNGKAPN
jgi:AraC family transcriptional regulator, transcriptional activator of the genes for pyochelin and ferripyochelin receptors